MRPSQYQYTFPHKMFTECKTIQPLVKCPLSPRRPRRMPSPKPRGRAVSPLAVFDGPG